MKNSNSFIICEVSGVKIKTELQQYFTTKKGLNSNLIEKIELYIYEDYSGFENSSLSGIVLKNGTTIRISDYDIESILKQLHAESIPQYKLVLFKPEPYEFEADNQAIPIEKCVVICVFVKLSEAVANADSAYQQMTDLIAYMQDINRGMFHTFSYDQFFSKTYLTYSWIQQIFKEKRYDYIEALIFNNLPIYRLSWNISQLFIENLSGLLQVAEVELINKLINAPEPLNDYWKDILRRKINVQIANNN